MRRLLFFCLLALLASCAEVRPPEKLTFAPVSFSSLPHWEQDDTRGFFEAFARVCEAARRRRPDAFFAHGAQAARFGRVKDWMTSCQEAKKIPDESTNRRAFIENNFQPFALVGAPQGLFTGYYEPEVQVDSTAHDAYTTPLFERPTDLISTDLGLFLPDLSGRKITGKVEKTRFIPYDTRAQIAEGSLRQRAKALAFARDPVDVFFLEIQGSGRLIYPDGSMRRIGFSAQNGHAFVPLGRILAERGLIEKPVTMRKIRSFLTEHPESRQAFLDENPSYVFFQERTESDPVGALGLPLVPERSLAVDRSFMPLGLPLWLDVGAPASPRLVVSMDTGGAIKGPVRGDLFWGHGDKAAEAAGSMQRQGTYYVLLPKGLPTP